MDNGLDSELQMLETLSANFEFDLFETEYVSAVHPLIRNHRNMERTHLAQTS